MKKIIFGIKHMAHLNFFKNAIYTLKEEGYNIEICYLKRGKIKEVLMKEYPSFSLTQIGQHSRSKIGKIRMVVEKFLLALNYLKKEKPDFVVAVGDFVLALASKLLAFPNAIFYDDYEFKINYNLSRFFGDKLIVPFPLPQEKKVLKYHSFKELAYIHPKYYKPNLDVIKKLNLTENNYVFIREVAGISPNYSHLVENSLIKPIEYLHSKSIKIILSLEDKTKKHFYTPYCTILEEPLEDVYSIMKHALFCLTSGDSMARESALLGVPTIYTGGRNMKVNHPLIKWGGIYKIESFNEIKDMIELLLNKNYKKKWFLFIDNKIRNDLLDTTEIIVKSDYHEILPKIVWFLDDLIADAVTIPVYLMSKLARKDMKVVFAGYSVYYHRQKFKSVKYMPEKLLNEISI